MTVCQACGTSARPTDHFCRVCGRGLDGHKPAGPVTEPYLPQERWWDRSGAAFRRHFKPIAVLAVIGTIVGLGALGGGESARLTESTTRGQAAKAVASDDTETADREDEPSSTETVQPESEPPGEAVEGANGKTYWCGPLEAAELDEIDGDIRRVRRLNRGLERRIREIERQYPDRTAPGDVVDRYNELVEKYNANVRTDRQLVDDYNAKLRANCTTG